MKTERKLVGICRCYRLESQKPVDRFLAHLPRVEVPLKFGWIPSDFLPRSSNPAQTQHGVFVRV